MRRSASGKVKIYINIAIGKKKKASHKAGRKQTHIRSYISHTAIDGFFFFVFFLITRNCRYWGSEARIKGIHQHAVATSNKNQDERSFSVATLAQYTQYGICIHSGRIPTATSLCSSNLQRCNIRSLCSIVYHPPSCSRYIRFDVLSP